MLYSCSGPGKPGLVSQEKDSTKRPQLDNRKKPPSSYHDTVIIQSRCAVFYRPDSVQLEKIKTVNEKMVFESLMHDCFYQMRNARLVIERYKPKIHIVEVTNARWLIFARKDHRRKTIDLDSINDICGIYLFDSDREPEQIDMMNIDTELGFYFKKQ